MDLIDLLTIPLRDTLIPADGSISEHYSNAKIKTNLKLSSCRHFLFPFENVLTLHLTVIYGKFHILVD